MWTEKRMNVRSMTSNYWMRGDWGRSLLYHEVRIELRKVHIEKESVKETKR